MASGRVPDVIRISSRLGFGYAISDPRYFSFAHSDGQEPGYLGRLTFDVFALSVVRERLRTEFGLNEDEINHALENTATIPVMLPIEVDHR